MGVLEHAGLLERVIARLLSGYDSARSQSLAAEAERTLMDFVLCAAAGAEASAGWLQIDGDRTATIIGRTERATPAVAAARNGCAAHLLDLDDLHWASLSHPGAYVWPVVLAVGEREGASGAEALRAAIVGYELTIRLARALGPDHRRFFHSSTTAGIVGASLSAALLCGASVQQAAWACGHAVSVGASLGEHLLERSGTEHFHRMFAAQTALLAAHAARRGLDGDLFALEGVRGLLAATANGGSREVLLEPLQPWGIEEVSLRYFHTTGWAQAAVEAALALGEIDVREVEQVVVHVPEVAIGVAGGAHPKSLEEAWWSIPYAVGVTVAYKDPRRLDDPSLLEDEKVRRLVQRVQLAALQETDAHRPATRVIVLRSDGSSLERTCDAPRGHPAHPFSEEDWLAKAKAMGLRLRKGAISSLGEVMTSFPDRSVPDWMQELGSWLSSESTR